MNVGRMREALATAKSVGARGFASYALAKALSRVLPRGWSVPVFSDYSDGVLVARSRTTDLSVFWQIFIRREYRCVDDLTDVDLVIDCGANVGYSAAYFLTRFPDCYVIAVEPDKSNFESLNRNCSRFRGRYIALPTAVWPRKTGLRISEEEDGLSGEWGYKVREVRPGEAAQMEAVDIGSLLTLSGRDRISILKMDVEGAEKWIFASGAEEWLAKVDVLVIELHGPECHEVFRRAISPLAFDLSTCDELTVARNRALPA